MDQLLVFKTTFRFGPDSAHEALIELDFLGREKYFVDGVLAHSEWTFSNKKPREFVSHGHTIQVRYGGVNVNRVVAEATIDGSLPAIPLFTELNERLERSRAARHASHHWGRWWLKVLAWTVASLILMTAYKAMKREGSPPTDSKEPSRVAHGPFDPGRTPHGHGARPAASASGLPVLNG